MEQLLALTYGDALERHADRSRPRTRAAAGSRSAAARTPTRRSRSTSITWTSNGNLCGTTGAACVAPGRDDAADRLVLSARLAGRRRLASAELPTDLKRITVTSTIARGFGGAMKASSTLTVLKTRGVLAMRTGTRAGRLLAAGTADRDGDHAGRSPAPRSSALLKMTDAQATIWNRTQMHSGIRGATEVLQQEVGQAGRIALPRRSR